MTTSHTTTGATTTDTTTTDTTTTDTTTTGDDDQGAQDFGRRPDGVSDATVEAVGAVSEALEWVERARGDCIRFTN